MPTLGGAPVTLRIPPGTANGRTFRVRGQGRAAQARRHARGDLLVTVEVDVPADAVDAEARAAVEALRDATTGDDPRAGLLAARRREPEMPCTADRDGAWASDDTRRSS